MTQKSSSTCTLTEAWYLRSQTNKHYFVALFWWEQRQTFFVAIAWGTTDRPGVKEKFYFKDYFIAPVQGCTRRRDLSRVMVQAYAKGIVQDKIDNRHHQLIWTTERKPKEFEGWYNNGHHKGLDESWPTWWTRNTRSKNEYPQHYEVRIGEEHWPE